MSWPEIPPAARSWDAWREFHTSVAPFGLSQTSVYQPGVFILFETDELVCIRGNADHTIRGLYRSINMSVLGSTTSELPAMTLPDGTPVKKAWLKHISQPLLVDHTTGHVVGMQYGRDLDIPSRFKTRKQISVYFPGPGRKPVGSPVSVTLPDKLRLSEDIYARVKEQVLRCKRVYQLDPAGQTPPVTRAIHAEDMLLLEGATDHASIWAAGYILTRAPLTRAVDFPYLLLAP